MTVILKTIGYGCTVSPALLLENCNQTIVTADKTKPNIILCMADDQGWGDMGYNGHPVIKQSTFIK